MSDGGISSPLSSSNPTRDKIYGPYEVRDATGSRSRIVEAFHVYNMAEGKPWEALDILPPVGTPHEDFPSVTVQQRYLMRRIGTTAAIYIVEYGIPSYSGGPRDSARIYQSTRIINIPAWQKDDQTTPANWVRKDQPWVVPETRLILSVTPSVPMVEVERITAPFVGMAGAVILSGSGLFYQYMGFSSYQQQGGLLRVDYTFRRDSDILAIQAGQYGIADHFIPFKPALYEYVPVPPKGSAAPSVEVAPIAGLHGVFDIGDFPQ